MAAELGISRANAYARVESLTAAGVITGYSAQVNPAALGLGVTALVFCSVQPQAWSDFLAAVSELPNVESAMVTTGEHDVMLLVRSQDVEGVHSLVVGEIAALPSVSRLETVLVLSEFLRTPYVLPDELPQRDPITMENGLMRFTATDPQRHEHL